jgi:hypothetical protein
MYSTKPIFSSSLFIHVLKKDLRKTYHVRNVERHGDDDQYSNDELAKYKKMIEDSKKPLYHGCAALYMRLFAMIKLF